MKVRQDAWSHEDDVLLAETVLKHIREGSTQLRAFDEVGDELNRTSAACGFRWNAIVRNKYNEEIASAKKERKMRKRAFSQVYERPFRISQPTEKKIIEQELTLDQVIAFLKQLHKQPSLQTEYESLKIEKAELEKRNNELQRELQQIKQETSMIEEDYQSLISIMNRARKLAILEEDESISNVAFKMDKNGNLQRLAK